MSFIELAKKRYSVRKFDTAREIEPQKLQYVLEVGRVAPTAKNNQPQVIYVAQSKESVEKLNKICPCIYGANTVMVIACDGDREWKSTTDPGRTLGDTDCAIICTHMILAAAEQGLGTCWVGLFNSDEVISTLGLEGNIRVCALLPIGYPADNAQPAPLHTQYREFADTIEEI